jgi:hypothetical protein
MTDTNHPSEDMLLAYALEGISSPVAEHLQSCSHCTAFVSDIKNIRQSIISIEEDDPLVQVRMRIMRKIENETPSGFFNRIFDFRIFNPTVQVIVILGFVLWVVAMYLQTV